MSGRVYVSYHLDDESDGKITTLPRIGGCVVNLPVDGQLALALHLDAYRARELLEALANIVHEQRDDETKDNDQCPPRPGEENPELYRASRQ